MSDLPKDLAYADYLLGKADTVENHEQRAKGIKVAFDGLNAYLAANPDSEHCEYVNNRKVAAIRRHMERLFSGIVVDWEPWLYSFFVFATSPQDLGRVFAKNPGLSEQYDRFLAGCPQQIKDSIRRHCGMDAASS